MFHAPRKSHKTQRSGLKGLLAGLIAGTASAASACGFHNYTPQPTLVDRLIDSEHVILARQNPENPFQYQAVATLEGNLDGVELPHLVDSVTRRRLLLDPNAQVLFAREGAYGPWQRVAFIDDDMRPVLDTVVTNLPAWEIGEDLSRFQTFAAYLSHSDAVVRKLALRELDRADYGFLVSHKIEIDTADTLIRLNNPAEQDLRAIRILLLGLSGNDDVRDFLETGLNRAIRFESPLTGAYATALIELDGPERATDLAHRYLANAEFTTAAKEALIEALALHSQYGEASMQQAVATSASDALLREPQLAPAVARQFGARGVWSQREALADLVQNGALKSPLDVLAVSQYVALADDMLGTLSQVVDGTSASGVFE